MSENNRNERALQIQKESKEVKEAIFRELLVKALKEGVKINEGNNGVIVRVEGGVLDEEIKNVNPKFEGQSLVSKIFKIDSVTEATNEFNVMSSAYDVLNSIFESSPDKVEEYAKIPQAHINYNLKDLDAELAETLSNYGVPAREGGSLNVIIMDAVDGKDFNTILFEEVAKRHPKLIDLKLENTSFKQLAYEVQVALKFSKSGTTGGGKELLDRENVAKVVDFFGIGKGKKGEGSEFRLPEDFFSKIANTIKLLNENGIYHRDLHERNIMMDKNGDVFVIDFGMGLNDKKVTDPYYSNLKGGEFNRDTGFVEFWQDIAEDRSEAGTKKKKKNILGTKLSRHFDMLEKRKMTQKFNNEMRIPVQSLFEAIKSGEVDDLIANKFYANLTTNRMLPPDESLIGYFLASELDNFVENEEEKKILADEIRKILQKRNISLYNKFNESANL
ncbi:MAG: protein kinase [Candidatus Magasanikbacteria bacterium]|nr:protein kinase [Candidatus Magasanikbacteria bacterium]